MSPSGAHTMIAEITMSMIALVYCQDIVRVVQALSAVNICIIMCHEGRKLLLLATPSLVLVV